MFVKPMNRQLQCPAGMEAGAPRVRIDQRLRLRRRLEQLGPFILKEDEISSRGVHRRAVYK